ncbi:MAG TPA: endonuclease III [Syntrophomonadaceae bacterium]|nr:endonuclease III [Syntrophomonadaceae bacterium]
MMDGVMMLTRKNALQILRQLQEEYPDAGTLLQYNSTFELLVAVVLSAQSTDEQVNRVTTQLFQKYSSQSTLAEAELSELEDIIRPVGIYRNKASHLKELARVIQEQYQGQVPDSLEELIKLPGVGRKSANVIIAVGFGQPGLGVDTHVQRVSNRLGLVRTKTPVQTEMGLKELLPREMWGKAHHILIFHGRRICKARKPDCPHCVVERFCAKTFDK